METVVAQVLREPRATEAHPARSVFVVFPERLEPLAIRAVRVSLETRVQPGVLVLRDLQVALGSAEVPVHQVPLALEV